MQLKVASPWPNLRGVYVETDRFEGRPAFVKRDSSETWIFFSARFGTLESFLRSSTDAELPELAAWPADVTFVGETEQTDQVTVPVVEQTCSDCRALQDLSEELSCSHCCPETADVVRALTLLRPVVGSSELQMLAKSCNVEATRHILEKVFQVSQSSSPEPVFIRQPPTCLEIGAGTASITCQAVSLQSPVRYQWYKDGLALHRAERPRLVVTGTPADEGIYTCTATVGAASICSSPCMLRLSESAHAARQAEAARRTRVESPMRRAAGAVQLGQLPRAVTLLAEAGPPGHSTQRAFASCC
ncbi:unnamed protein product [Symbiodinium pilosum]|uniref:Ig-like domain-containing protein n=1 Tax=Symbiodinium pilosum TaxID=2952 RepID=A0A812W8N9_SYMPI|nr:unnamed protein product [Symbiodinium pilosum]